MLKNKAILFCFCAVGMALSLACNRTSSASSEQGNIEKTESANKAQTPGRNVARIVFVGQKQACDCTRERIETTWTALNAVLKMKPGLPVERIQRDVDIEKTEKMAELKPLMVAPGIYFIDAKDGLLELRQGDVSKEQIEKILL